MPNYDNLPQRDQRTAYSAGGVIYRSNGTGFEVALIATQSSSRWGLPKGHVRRGETAEAAAEAMQFVAADGAVHSGFAALRWIVHALPFGFLVSPWFALPGVRHAGDRAYAAVAARRSCRLEDAPEHVGVTR